MYTQEDVRKLFMQRGEIEMELKVRQAQYYGKEAEIPSEMAARVMELQRELMTIDGFFAALSENEAFVIRHHLMEELDWPQTMTLLPRPISVQTRSWSAASPFDGGTGLAADHDLVCTEMGRGS